MVRFAVWGLVWLLTTGGCAMLRGDPSPGVGDEELVPSMQVYTTGERVMMVLQVTNTSDTPVDVTFPTGQAYEFVIEQGGREIWRWSNDQMFTQALRHERIEPGETVSYEASWSPAEESRGGSFVARGTVEAQDRRIEQTAEFELR